MTYLSVAVWCTWARAPIYSTPTLPSEFFASVRGFKFSCRCEGCCKGGGLNRVNRRKIMDGANRK